MEQNPAPAESIKQLGEAAEKATADLKTLERAFAGQKNYPSGAQLRRQARKAANHAAHRKAKNPDYKLNEQDANDHGPTARQRWEVMLTQATTA